MQLNNQWDYLDVQGQNSISLIRSIKKKKNSEVRVLARIFVRI